MSILKDTQELISRATLKIHTERRGDGQCVVVEDGMIITAAHCVDWNNDGGMTLGYHCLSKISTEAGNVTGSVSAVEPVSDVAILECPSAATSLEAAATILSLLVRWKIFSANRSKSRWRSLACRFK